MEQFHLFSLDNNSHYCRCSQRTPRYPFLGNSGSLVPCALCSSRASFPCSKILYWSENFCKSQNFFLFLPLQYPWTLAKIHSIHFKQQNFCLRLKSLFLNWNYLIIYRWLEIQQNHNCRFQNSKDSSGFLSATNTWPNGPAGAQGLAHLPKHFFLTSRVKWILVKADHEHKVIDFIQGKAGGFSQFGDISGDIYLHSKEDFIPSRDRAEFPCTTAEISLSDFPELCRATERAKIWERKSRAGSTEMGTTASLQCTQLKGEWGFPTKKKKKKSFFLWCDES